MARLKLTCALLTLWFASPMLFAADWPCGHFAKSSTDLPFFLDHFGSLSDDEKLTSSDRALFMLSRCPDDFYYQMSTIPKFFDLWVERLPQLANAEPESSPFLSSLMVMLKGQLVSNDYKHMQTQLMKELNSIFPRLNETQSSRLSRDWQCSLAGSHVIRGAVADWKRADGAEWKVVSDDFLFLLASCPDNFYATFSDERTTLRDWLGKLPDLSFAADPDFKPTIETFRLNLINMLKKHKPNPKNRSVQKSILTRVMRIRFRTID